eukprot:1662277-Rhodomonas_salina.1
MWTGPETTARPPNPQRTQVRIHRVALSTVATVRPRTALATSTLAMRPALQSSLLSLLETTHLQQTDRNATWEVGGGQAAQQHPRGMTEPLCKRGHPVPYRSRQDAAVAVLIIRRANHLCRVGELTRRQLWRTRTPSVPTTVTRTACNTRVRVHSFHLRVHATRGTIGHGVIDLPQPTPTRSRRNCSRRWGSPQAAVTRTLTRSATSMSAQRAHATSMSAQ